ncbi:hypothetical protein J4E81_006286 [Alternaria sp. BMP 2799]|nr:hypothetical protein J4E81_006286 [Alternaria sp. BMP 2799]
MIKEPIEVVPAGPNERIRRESRIRFGKVYPIEMNVKVKDIGRVREDQIRKSYANPGVYFFIFDRLLFEQLVIGRIFFSAGVIASWWYADE